MGSLGSNGVWPDVWLDGGFQHLCIQPHRLAREKEQRDGAGVGRFETPWEKTKGGPSNTISADIPFCGQQTGLHILPTIACTHTRLRFGL